MESVFKIIGRILIIISLLVQTGAMAYFANFTKQKLRPYFVAHGMDEDAQKAKKAYVCLCLMAISSSLGVVTQIRSIYEYMSEKEKEKEREKDNRELLIDLILSFINYGTGLPTLVLACITVNASLRWWRYFEDNDIGYFAQMSRGLFAMIITIFMIAVCFIIFISIVPILVYLTAKLRPKRDTTAPRDI